jgi:hypothetical protein
MKEGIPGPWNIKAGRGWLGYIPGGGLPRTGDATSGGHRNGNDGRIPLEGRACRYDALRRNADTLWSVLIPVIATCTADLPSDGVQEPKSGHPMFHITLDFAKNIFRSGSKQTSIYVLPHRFCCHMILSCVTLGQDLGLCKSLERT